MLDLSFWKGHDPTECLIRRTLMYCFMHLFPSWSEFEVFGIPCHRAPSACTQWLATDSPWPLLSGLCGFVVVAA